MGPDAEGPGSSDRGSRAATLSLGPPAAHDSILSENTESRGCKQATTWLPLCVLKTERF